MINICIILHQNTVNHYEYKFIYFHNFMYLTTKRFNYGYKNKQNWQVGLYIFVVITS
jgi:hypothetical protein